MISTEQRICVIGAGTMGGQIAHAISLAGYPTTLFGRSSSRLQTTAQQCADLLQRRVDKRSLTTEDRDGALERLRLTTDLEDAVQPAALIIESVAEDRGVKTRVLEAISGIADETALIGTNSSTMPSSMFAGAVANPGRLFNLHFYNPALTMPLVEIAGGEHTAAATLQSAVDFVDSIEKKPVLLEKETFGFIANRLLFIAMQEAFALVESGAATIEAVDQAARSGLGWPMGPFEIADLVGLDVVEDILNQGGVQTGEERWGAPAILRDRVAAGKLGRKTGEGFRRSR